ncbi:MAG: hypothetical protein GYA31_02670 [Parcubacteria group bacterium]|nr:hypothetical protein [Parcubacteria group bacterium]
MLPPYTSFSYIFHYSWQHYFFAPIVTILFALIILWGIKKLNKKFNETFFYDEEPYLAALGILATGWPNCLFYLSLVLFLGMISHCIVFLINFLNYKRRRGEVTEKTVAQAERAWFLNKAKKSEAERERSDLAGVGHSVFSKQPFEPLRLSLLYFWLPCALLTLLLSDIINKYLIINQLVI